MLGGSFALLERSLRVDLRTRSNHLLRLGLMGAIYLSLCSAVVTLDRFSAPGLRFFQWITYLDLMFLTLMGIGFFSNVITEEKEEDTLGLILMAGIGPLGILIGKSLGQLWQAILLICVQYPFVLLAVTMGGVTSDQVRAVTVSLMAYTVFLAGFGLLCSTIASRAGVAARLMIFGLFLYHVVPSIAAAIHLQHLQNALNNPNSPLPAGVWRLLGLVGEINIFDTISNTLSSGFDGSIFNTQVISNVLIGLFCLGLSRLLFGLATRNPSTETQTRGLVSQRRGTLAFSAGRVWNNPFLWKDYYFVSGGIVWSVFRVVLYSLLGLIPFLSQASRSETSILVGVCFFAIMMIASINASNLIARSLQEEVRGQTLQSLLILPHSTAGIVYSKLAGALLGWLPGPLLGVLCLLLSRTVREGLIEAIFDVPNPLQFLIIVMSVGTFGSFFILIPHFAGVFAVTVRWGTVAMAIAATMGVYMVAGTCMSLPMIFLSPSAEIYVISNFIVYAAVCVWCHWSMLRRIDAMRAK